MSIETRIAGDAASVVALADELDGGFAAALNSLELGVMAARNSLGEIWTGEGGLAAQERVTEAVEVVHPTCLCVGDISEALRAFARAMVGVQDEMAQARSIAVEGGVPVRGTLIVGPPTPGDPAWPRSVLPPTEPAAEVAYLDWCRQQHYYEMAEDLADEAYRHFAEAARELIGELGENRALLSGLDDQLRAMTAGIIGLPARVLPLTERRLQVAAARAGVLASLSSDQSQVLYDNLFMQVDQLDDAALLRRVSRVSRIGGTGADLLMTGLSAIERQQAGQGYDQILLAEGGGALAGMTTTAIAWGTTGGAAGSTLGPVGTVVAGVGAVGAGALVGGVVRGKVDDWYRGREFEQAMREQIRADGQDRREQTRRDRDSPDDETADRPEEERPRRHGGRSPG